MLKKLTVCLLLATFILNAAETDAFTERYQANANAIPLINQEINARMNKVIQTLNDRKDSNRKCDWDELDSLIGDQLRFPLQGKIEHFITTNESLPKSHTDYDNSVFKYLPFIYNIPIKVGIILGLGFTAPIYYDGLLVGADKFGHFLDEGYSYYTLINKWDFSIDQVLKFGDFLEYTLFGKLLGGVYSYGDLAANYDGYRFWTNLLGSSKLNSKSIYLSCTAGRWHVKLPIDLSLYITPAWDEGMNCSEFRSEGMSESIQKSIRELEAQTHKRYQCPVYPERVKFMIKSYGKYAKDIINPQLLN